jgi:oligopeptide/dipeptide ABC transporter ATP-binding protein
MATADEASNTLNPPVGCSFQDRCPMQEKRCEHDPIEFEEVGPDHRVRCWKVTRNGTYSF